jgi:putative colanic acid biosynthesis acetyltransferase WcaF
VGPGVTIGELAVVGARSVVVKDVPAGKVTAGNPSRVIKERMPPAV